MSSRKLGFALLALLSLAAGAQAPPSAQTVTRTAANGGSLYSCPFCDLRNAAMANMDLTDANLQGANLQGADMRGANLSGTILARANLSGANLSGARLGRSSKGRTDLSLANLDGATLTGAVLDGTDLQYSNLAGVSGANYGNSVIRPAVPRPAGGDAIACGNADLSWLKSRVYVSAAGSDLDSCGTSIGIPCATIQKGISRCSPSGCGVLVLWGEFKLATTIQLVDGINVYGGCTTRMLGAAPLQTLINAPPNGLPAVSASNIVQGGAILQGFKLAASPAVSPGAQTIALSVVNSPRFAVIDTTVLASYGANGAPGSRGGAGAAGVMASGVNAGTQATCSEANGGNGSVAMGVYLTGNEFGFTCNPTCSANSCYGYWSAAGAAGGQPGLGYCDWCTTHPGALGYPGMPGPDSRSCGGKGFASGSPAGTFSGGAWRPGVGTAGGGGGAGAGGGGGGSGGYRAGYCFGPRIWEGIPGRGGGSGGCGGGGGGPAQQGGASFAVVVVNSPLSITDSIIVGAVGGAGGMGGSGGPGGERSVATGSLCIDGFGCGGQGGSGGVGAAGGGGAGGNGGPAVGIALAGATLTGHNTAYYTGRAGATGGFGPGGQPIFGGLCAGAPGDAGIPGAAVDTQAY